jgi:phage shock protein A
VTGVQTCALPICLRAEQRLVDQQREATEQLERERAQSRSEQLAQIERQARLDARLAQLQAQVDRSDAERLR